MYRTYMLVKAWYYTSKIQLWYTYDTCMIPVGTNTEDVYCIIACDFDLERNIALHVLYQNWSRHETLILHSSAALLQCCNCSTITTQQGRKKWDQIWRAMMCHVEQIITLNLGAEMLVDINKQCWYKSATEVWHTSRN